MGDVPGWVPPATRGPAGPGFFAAFEGVEGAGKSTQVQRLATRLRELGLKVVETREPGGTPVGARIRSWLLEDEGLCDRAEALAFMVDRAQHVHEVLPYLERGEVVLTDRFTGSSVANQGAGRGLGEKWIHRLSGWAAGGVAPDLTVLLDVPVRTGLERAGVRGDVNRFERADLEFHERVRQSLLNQAKAPSWVVVPGWLAEDVVAELVEQAVMERLSVRLGVR